MALGAAVCPAVQEEDFVHMELNRETLELVLQPHSQRVRNHGYRTKGHGNTGEHWV